MSHSFVYRKDLQPGALRAGEASDDTPTLRETNQLRLTVESLYAREAMLEAVINSLPAWISVKDTDGRYLLVNDAMAQAFGGRAADFLGRRAEDLPALPHQAKQVAAQADAEVLATGQGTERLRYPVRLSDGRERIRHLTKMPFSDEDGRLLGVVSWSDDTTEAVLAEDALESHRQLLRTVIEAVPHPIAYTDADGRLLMANPALCRMLGCTAEEVLGRTLGELLALPAQVRERIHEDTAAIFRTGQVPAPIEYAGTDPQGRIVHQVISRAPVRRADGAIEAVVNIAVDVSELRRAEREALLAHQRLTDAMESLPAAFYLYDAQERLIMANSTATQYYPDEAYILRPGASYNDIMRAGLSSMKLDAEQREGRLQHALHTFREPPESFEQALADGRILLARNRRTSEGGTVCVRVDITEQKRIQAELEQRERQIQDDLALAADLQRSILQTVQPPGFLEAAWHFQPSSPVSGDIYHARTDVDGAFHFFIGDATGHGVVAAFMTMLAEAGLRSVAPATPPDAALAQLNRQLLQYQLEGRFLSGICMRIAPDGTLSVANAGHPPALVLCDQGRQVRQLELGGFPLGWFADAPYQAQTLRMVPGDTVVLYTDGLTEWSDTEGLQFGESGLQSVLNLHPRSRPQRLLQQVLASAARHAKQCPATDDQTVFVFTYRGATER
ncbi:MAG TPA: SpoIIE family protein phosphatase [bacterium]|nr:SpoIIE family protein phosphatase [bacterium]